MRKPAPFLFFSVLFLVGIGFRFVPSNAVAQDAGTDGGCPCACPEPIPDHAFVAPNGSDATGNGSIGCPFLTPQKAQQVIAAAPTSQAEYLRPRVVELLGPGTYTGSVTFPTISAVTVVVGAGVTLAGYVGMESDVAQRFGAPVPPRLFVYGIGGRESCVVGDGADSIKVTTPMGATSTSVSVFLQSIRTTGAITEAIASPNVVSLAMRDVLALSSVSTTTHEVSGDSISLNANGCRFLKKVNIDTLLNVFDTLFTDDIQANQGGPDSTKGLTGCVGCRFAKPVSGTKWFRVGGPVRIDSVANQGLKASGWAVADGGIVQLVSDMTPIVVTP